MPLERDLFWMKQALILAQRAADLGEVPVGALIVQDDQLLATGYNRRELDRNCLAHAEMIVLEGACKKLGGWRLENTTLYVTLEPCPMCGGGIINARVPRVVFGAFDPKAGCFGSVAQFHQLPFNHQPEIVSGVMAKEAGELLKDFFRQLRK